MQIRIQTSKRDAEALSKKLGVKWRPMREGAGAFIYLRDATGEQLATLAQHKEASHAD